MHLTTLLLTALPLVAGFADPVLHERARSRSRHHTELAKRQTYSGRATYYAVGLGACGWNNVASDYIVALNSPQFGGGYPGPNCGKSITITANGVSVQATIADQCPSCGFGDLDLSEGLFTRFASTGAGVFQMSWSYNDGTPQPEPTTEKPQPQPTTPTSTYTPPTSTYTPPTTTSTQPTSTYVAPTSTVISTSEIVTSTSTSAPVSAVTSVEPSGITTNGTVLPFVVTSDSTASATASADSAIISGTVPISELGNLVLFNQAVTYLGNIVVVGASQ